jgi:hypothetical protein
MNEEGSEGRDKKSERKGVMRERRRRSEMWSEGVM